MPSAIAWIPVKRSSMQRTAAVKPYQPNLNPQKGDTFEGGIDELVIAMQAMERGPPRKSKTGDDLDDILLIDEAGTNRMQTVALLREMRNDDLLQPFIGRLTRFSQRLRDGRYETLAGLDTEIQNFWMRIIEEYDPSYDIAVLARTHFEKYKKNIKALLQQGSFLTTPFRPAPTSPPPTVTSSLPPPRELLLLKECQKVEASPQSEAEQQSEGEDKKEKVVPSAIEIIQAQPKRRRRYRTGGLPRGVKRRHVNERGLHAAKLARLCEDAWLATLDHFRDPLSSPLGPVSQSPSHEIEEEDDSIDEASAAARKIERAELSVLSIGRLMCSLDANPDQRRATGRLFLHENPNQSECDLNSPLLHDRNSPDSQHEHTHSKHIVPHFKHVWIQTYLKLFEAVLNDFKQYNQNAKDKLSSHEFKQISFAIDQEARALAASTLSAHTTIEELAQCLSNEQQAGTILKRIAENYTQFAQTLLFRNIIIMHREDDQHLQSLLQELALISASHSSVYRNLDLAEKNLTASTMPNNESTNNVSDRERCQIRELKLARCALLLARRHIFVSYTDDKLHRSIPVAEISKRCQTLLDILKPWTEFRLPPAWTALPMDSNAVKPNETEIQAESLRAAAHSRRRQLADFEPLTMADCGLDFAQLRLHREDADDALQEEKHNKNAEEDQHTVLQTSAPCLSSASSSPLSIAGKLS